MRANLLSFIRNSLTELADCGTIQIMIIEVNEPKDCPFINVDDCGAGCTLDFDIHCWHPTWSDFPSNCPLAEKKNIEVQYVSIKKT